MRGLEEIHDRVRKEMNDELRRSRADARRYKAAAQRFGVLALALSRMAADDCTVIIRAQLKEVREFLKRNQ